MRRPRRSAAPVRMTAVAAVLMLAAAACGGSPTASGGQETTSSDTDFAALAALPDDELAQQAEEEGQLSLYTSMTANVVDDVVAAFEESYDIDVEVYRANSETVLQRVLQEQQAGFAGADAVETNVAEMTAIDAEGYFAPYSGAPRDSVVEAGKFPGWTATRFNIFAPSWNTNLVPAGQEPTSWEELADPKWAGKISMEVGDVDWFLTLWGYWLEQGKTEQEVEALFRAMASNAKVVKGHTVQGELLSAGQFAIAVSNYTYLIQQVIDKGAPVAYEPLVEPVLARPNGIGLLANAQHPAAAVLFTNWMLTDGQEVMMDYAITPSVEGLDTVFADVEQVPIDVETLTSAGKEWSDRYQQIVSQGEQIEEEG